MRDRQIPIQAIGSVHGNARLIDEKLKNIRVCDPAVGSGAFLVGMMAEIVKARCALTPYLNAQTGMSVLPYRSPYNFKRHAIQNCLYGVDIDPSVVEITKLRLWLSLVVDEEDRQTIQPLPNLDYKIVCGNSLLGFPFKSNRILGIENLKKQFFDETSLHKKEVLKIQIDKQIQEAIAVSKQTIGYEVNFDFELFFSEVFHEKGGFDVVIANPPYVRQEKIKEIKPLLQTAGFEIYNATSDIYTYFYEKSYKILRENGVSCFISSNKWLRAKYGYKLRNFLKNKTVIKQIIDFNGYKVFDATVDTNVIIFQKATNPDNTIEVLNVLTDFTPETNIKDYFNTHKIRIKQADLEDNCFTFGDSLLISLKKKIEKKGVPLKDWDVKIYCGIKTGFNEAFIIDSKKRQEILDNCKDEDERKRTEGIIKPILRGRDIGRYYYKWAGLWLIKIESGWTNLNRGKSEPEKFFKETYPTVYNYLKSFIHEKGKGKGLLHRDDQGDYWWELRDCDYYPEFEKEKIIYPDIQDKLTFSFDSKSYLLSNTAYFTTGWSLKALLAILNSKLVAWFYKKISSQLGAKVIRHFSIFIEQISIPNFSEIEKKTFIELVDKILALTETADYLENESKQAQVREYERQIDQLVYKLYDLTPEEIEIVEGKSL